MPKCKPRPLPVLRGEEARAFREQFASPPDERDIRSNERAIAIEQRYKKE
jgi:hypothetical protein